jgi:hypothetical protein
MADADANAPAIVCIIFARVVIAIHTVD